MARHGRTLLRGGLQLRGHGERARREPGAGRVADRSEVPAEGRGGTDGEELRDLLRRIATNDYCVDNDLVDPITIFVATGLRRSELLALRWSDYDAKAGTLR